jgi:hypothetical protein
MTKLPIAEASVGSLSCLHVLEHIGLDRYGDLVDPLSSLHTSKALVSVLTPGGWFYMLLPIGRERVGFNAHRVFSSSTVRGFFQDLELDSFFLIDDSGQLNEGVTLDAAAHLEYGCGLFEFVKTRE